MILEITIVILLQLFFFTFYYFKGPFVSKIIGKRVCPTCFSVGSTWLTLLIVKYSGLYDINHMVISILFAESVVGVSYLVDEFLARYSRINIPDAVMKFGIVIYGTLAVMVSAFLNFPLGAFMFLTIILFGFWALTPTR